ncbi:hypothetical protein V8F20_009873 [Naviculisporaceae sp. PSN 640]
MAAEVEQRHIPLSVNEDDFLPESAPSLIPPNMEQETGRQVNTDLKSMNSTLAEKPSIFDLQLKGDAECDNMSDNDSAKAGLDDSTDDELLTATSTNDPLDSDISAARQIQTSRLAEIYSRIEQATRDHDAAIEALFRARIASLTQTIRTGEQEREDLTQLIRQKDAEIQNLQQEMTQEKQRHSEELAQQTKLAHEERVRAGKEWEREFNEAMEKRGREHQESMEQQHQHHQKAMAEQQQQHHQAMEEQQQQHQQAMEVRGQEHQQALESLRQQLTQESEQRISSLIEEMGRETEQRVNKVRSEMDQMRAEFEREREQTMKEMRGEMARLVEREREAREKLRRAETMPFNNGSNRGHGGQSRDQSPHVRPGLQQSSSWAIARLWGVGQPRTRSFS